MNLLEKTDEEILDIANPFWDNLVKSSNKKDYFEFIKDFSAKMLFGANEQKQENSGQIINYLQVWMKIKFFQDVYEGMDLLPFYLNKKVIR